VRDAVEPVDGGHLEEQVVHEPLDAGGLLEALRQVVEVLGHRPGVGGEGGEVADQRARALERGAADVGGVAERAERGNRRLRERAELTDEAREVRRGAARVGEHRRELVGDLLEVREHRPQLAQVARQPLEGPLDVGAALGGRLGGLVGVVDEAGDAVAAGGEWRQHAVGLAREAGERAVLVGQDREHAVGLAQRGVRAVDRLVQLVAAAGERRAELVQDQREPLAVRESQRVVDQVQVDRRARVLDAQQVLALAVAVLDLRELRRPVRAGTALDELLADQRLRADRAARVLVERREAGLVDLQDDRRALVVGHVERLDLTDDRARDLHVLALHDVGRVVEDRADLVALAAGLAGAHAEHEQRRQADAQHEECRDPPDHGPGGVVSGSQSKLPSAAVPFHGFEPSGAGWIAPPGQRCDW
jgi:hypothetical protein